MIVRPVEDLAPGSHLILLSRNPTDVLRGRQMGLDLRDTLLVLRPEGSEFAFLFRKKPAGTVAWNVARHGVGALRIDACRIPTNEVLNGGTYTGEYREKTTEWGQNFDRSEGKGSGFRQGIGEYQSPMGRWPSNLVFIHGEGCQRIESPQTQTVWVCGEGCPVRALDHQGGTMPEGADDCPSRFYPQFASEPELLGWLWRLLGVNP